jgi:outer membrane protein TolC
MVNRISFEGGVAQHRTKFGILSLALTALLAIVLVSSAAVAQEPATQAPGPAPAQSEARVELVQPPNPAGGGAAASITLKDAFDMARKNDPTFAGAMLDAKSAREDRLQARNALLPTISETTQYLGTQGDGGKISDGRFVTNDGIHVYREWGVLHEDITSNTFTRTGYQRAKAAEAVAQAKAEIARQGLYVTVTKAFYGLVVAQRKFATAQESIGEGKRFFDMAGAGEKQGQAAHSDTLKAEIQYRIQEQAFDEARLALDSAKLNLAVLLFPSLNVNFTVVDDLDAQQAMPPFADVRALAEKRNPDLRAAMETQKQAEYDVTTAKAAFLPTLSIDFDYGIEANCFAFRCARASFPEIGVVPNLGYFLTAALNIPVWDWGTLRSKVHQAEYKRDQAKLQLTQTQRASMSELYSSYNEAVIARSAVEASHHTAELATESLRLVNLRYQSGASPATEVVDAQNTLITARNAYDDAQVRYKTALANLQTLTGNF